MKKLAVILSGYLLIGIICYSRLVQAGAYTPDDNAEILAAGEVIASREKFSLTQLSRLVEQGQIPGQSKELQENVKRQVESHYRQNPTADTAYLYARLLQREHEFSGALEILGPLLAKAPEQVNARILQAGILMVQGKYHQAKQSCQALSGHIEIAVVAICTLDALSQGLGAGQQTQLKQYYQLLLKLFAKDKTDMGELVLWVNQILAEMALRLNQPLAASKHLSQISLEQAPVSLRVLWADIALALGRYQMLLSRLPGLAGPEKMLPDALLLRLAIAEKNVGIGDKWQPQLAQRMNLREIRQDKEHAGELARYYLEVNFAPEKAKYWAELNYQQTKMASDRDLLVRAFSADATGERR